MESRRIVNDSCLNADTSFNRSFMTKYRFFLAFSTTTYSDSGWTHRERFEGMVHGVVVYTNYNINREQFKYIQLQQAIVEGVNLMIRLLNAEGKR